MIAIIDYDAGNLKSVEKALVSLGEEVLVSRDSSEILHIIIISGRDVKQDSLLDARLICISTITSL